MIHALGQQLGLSLLPSEVCSSVFVAIPWESIPRVLGIKVFLKYDRDTDLLLAP